MFDRRFPIRTAHPAHGGAALDRWRGVVVVILSYGDREFRVAGLSRAPPLQVFV